MPTKIVNGVREEMTTGEIQEKEAREAVWVAEAEQRAWAELRAERNARLAACDWTMTLDATLTTETQTAWHVYRQALRDLPANTTDPRNVTWPIPPE